MRKKGFPKARVATFDICDVGQRRHHIPALIEVDVTDGRKRIRELKRGGRRISFTAWLLKLIAGTIKDHEDVAAFLRGKSELIIFDDINISMIVEMSSDGHKIPIPFVFQKVQEHSVESITKQIQDAKSGDLLGVVGSKKLELLYYYLPGFLRRIFWRFMLKSPRFAFGRMGNVAVTSLGMMGNANGWFIPISVHPVCFGIGKVSKKAKVIEERVEIREILNITVLMDHDVIDGAQMARFISDFTRRVESSNGLDI